jgi:hypothetical protein
MGVFENREGEIVEGPRRIGLLMIGGLATGEGDDV